MKTFNASQLNQSDRRKIFAAAKEEGAIIQKKNTNGEVLEEFVMMDKDKLKAMECDYNIDRFVGLSGIINES